MLLLLLHFSIAVSRLTDQTKVLAQRLALLEERQRHGETAPAPAPAAYRPAAESAAGRPAPPQEPAGEEVARGEHRRARRPPPRRRPWTPSPRARGASSASRWR